MAEEGESLGDMLGPTDQIASGMKASTERTLVGPVRVMIISPAIDKVIMSVVSPSIRFILLIYTVLCVRLLGPLGYGYTRQYIP